MEFTTTAIHEYYKRSETSTDDPRIIAAQVAAERGIAPDVFEAMISQCSGKPNMVDLFAPDGGTMHPSQPKTPEGSDVF